MSVFLFLVFALLLLTLGCDFPLIAQTKEPNIEKVQLKKRIVDIEVTYPALNIPVSSKGFPINFGIKIENKGNETIYGKICLLGTSNWKIKGEGSICKSYVLYPSSYTVVKIPGEKAAFWITPTIAEEEVEIKVKNCYNYTAEAEIYVCLSEGKCESRINIIPGPVEFSNIQVLPAFYDPQTHTYKVYITFDIVKKEEGVIIDPGKVMDCPPYKQYPVTLKIKVEPLIPSKSIKSKCEEITITNKGSGACEIDIPESYLEGGNYIYFPIRLKVGVGFETLDTIFLNLKPIRT